MRPIARDVARSVVGLSVCVLITRIGRQEALFVVCPGRVQESMRDGNATPLCRRTSIMACVVAWQT